MASFQSFASSSSSSSKPTRGWTYDVFLSFRGEDTRNNFVDHLHGALVQKGIYTFKDDQMIRQGKPISPELLKAIEESRFAVIVFSKNYANSSWCLEELAKIMECKDQMGLKVLPVFYHVDPSHVRKPKRSFAAAFLSGERKKIKKWREALASAASLSGFHISAVSGGESAAIIKIVQQILRYMNPPFREINLIGIDSHMDALNPLLSIEVTHKVRIIGIFGMGGIGKTTIARALFRRIANRFEGSCFINDVRENSLSKKDLCRLQKKILKDILEVHHDFRIEDPEEGSYMISERLCNKKIFLVLDDVDNFKQLEFLAAKHEWFGEGSRILITTRNEHLLSGADEKYTPRLLPIEQALELFSTHAFRKNSPPDGFKELSNRAITYTSGLPLALKVLGSFLCGRKLGVWKSALDSLADIPNDEIFKTLKLSFDGLLEHEKNIFLDIACFFKGKEVDDVIRMLDSFDFYARIGITSLIEKSLITISKRRLNMHDLIQQMGWQIVRETAPNSKLWRNEEIHDFIIKNKKFESVEAIVNPLPCDVFLKQGFSTDVFNNMNNLRLLDVNRMFTLYEPAFLPHELRWLRWNQYPFFSLPLANMCKLVGLEVSSGNIQNLWNGRKIMLNLKFLKLEELDSLLWFPDVSGAPNIERLILSRCGSMVEVHESLGLLKRLVYLDMTRCLNLKHLPSKFEMESLEALVLNSCESLEKLPEFSSCMVKLVSINCGECYALRELPSSISNISSLSILNLTSCRSLINIPNFVCKLKCLATLSLHGCSKLHKLPDEFGNMKNLQELILGQAESFNFQSLINFCYLRKLDLSWNNIGYQDFPENLYGFSSLEELSLRGNSKLIRLPASITHLSCLKYLDLSKCDLLQSFNGLPSGIQILDASNCMSLELLKDLSEEYKWLHKIHLFSCKKLLPDKQNETYLDKLLKKSFLKKWAAVDGCLSIGIPGSEFPSWFKQQLRGNKIALKLPFKWQTKIIGFAICGLFRCSLSWAFPSIELRFENYGTFVPMLEVDYINASTKLAVDEEIKNVWIAYVPFSLLENMHHDCKHDDDDDDCVGEREDWSHIIEGNLIIELTSAIHGKAVSCAAEVLYKEDVDLTQQSIKQSIFFSNYWSWKLTHDRWTPNTIQCL